MKLIYAQGACSLSVHILLEELNLEYQPIKVSLEDKTVLEHFTPKSYVPVLVLDSGVTMTEATSILQYLAIDHDSSFLSKDLFTRAKCIEWLTFISTELHKGAAPLFQEDKLPKDYVAQVREKLDKRLQLLDGHLNDQAFVIDNSYSIADMYAVAILRILEHVKVDLSQYSNLYNYKKNLEDSPTIKRTIEAEKSAETVTEIDDESVNISYYREEVRGVFKS
jgi:glutathione S-transferase